VTLSMKEEVEGSKEDLSRGIAFFGMGIPGWNEASERARADPRWGKPNETFGVDRCVICRICLTSWLDPESKPAHPFCYYNRATVEELRGMARKKRAEAKK